MLVGLEDEARRRGPDGKTAVAADMVGSDQNQIQESSESHTGSELDFDLERERKRNRSGFYCKQIGFHLHHPADL